MPFLIWTILYLYCSDWLWVDPGSTSTWSLGSLGWLRWSAVTPTLTRSRWRADTWARRTSRPCRWRWSWPAAGRRCRSSCRVRSPEPSHSSQTSSCLLLNQGLSQRRRLHWCRLREKDNGVDRINCRFMEVLDISEFPRRCINRSELTLWGLWGLGAFLWSGWVERTVEVVNLHSTTLTFNWTRGKGEDETQVN